MTCGLWVEESSDLVLSLNSLGGIYQIDWAKIQRLLDFPVLDHHLKNQACCTSFHKIKLSCSGLASKNVDRPPVQPH